MTQQNILTSRYCVHSPRQGECAIVASINDKDEWKTVKNALQVVNIDEINTNVSWMLLRTPGM